MSLTILSVNSSYGSESNQLEVLANIEQDYKGYFVQKRKLKIIEKPFVSSGEFELNSKFLLWHIKSPYEVIYNISAETIEETIDGKIKTQELKNNPEIAFFSQIFTSVLKMDISLLQENFHITQSNMETEWSLLLVPKKKPLNKVFSEIKVQGDNKINLVITRSLSGDTNNIHLSYEFN